MRSSAAALFVRPIWWESAADSGLGELAAGHLGEMPMRHQGLVECQWPRLEHKIHGGTEPSYSFQSEFG
jgi:hypothetical protein